MEYDQYNLSTMLFDDDSLLKDEFEEGLHSNVSFEITVFNSETGKITFTNGYLANVLKYDKEEYEQKSLGNLIHSEDLFFYTNVLNSLLQNRLMPVALRLKHKDEGYHWFKFHLAFTDRSKNQITALIKEINQDLVFSENFYHHQQFAIDIAAASPLIIFVYDNEKNRNVYQNQRMYEVLGYTEEEFKPSREFLRQLYHPDEIKDLSYYFQQIITRLKDNEIVSKEYRLRHKDGNWIWIYSCDKVFRRNEKGEVIQTIGILQDITERKRNEQKFIELNNELYQKNIDLLHQEEKLTQSNQMLIQQQEAMKEVFEKFLEKQQLIEGIARAVPAELLAFNVSDFNIIFSNKKLAWILGYSVDEFQNLNAFRFLRLIHPDETSNARMVLQKLKEQAHSIKSEIRLRHKKGHYKWIYADFVPLEKGDNIKYIALLYDISQVKLTQERLKKLNKELYVSNIQLTKKEARLDLANKNLLNKQEEIQKSYEQVRMINHELTQKQQELEFTLNELSNKNFELDQLVYKISHDLRSPLSTILGLVNVIKMENDLGKQMNYVGLIENRILKLDGFIKSMLNYAKTSRTQIVAEEIDFRELIQGCLSDLEYLENFKRMHTLVQIDPPGEPFYNDFLRINIIFSNIISNAFKYYNPNEEYNYLKINIHIRPEMVNVSFEDNGIGIHKEYLHKIYDMFFRATQKSDGSGLGMYIVKQTVEKLKGNIQVESNAGIGTRFDLTLPNLR